MASISASLPRGAGGSPASTVMVRPSSGSVRKPLGTSCHHGTPASCASSRTAENVRYPEPDKSRVSLSTGASPPMVAAVHEASRNSRPAAARSPARRRTLSGSHTTTRVPSGMSIGSVAISPGTRTEVSASMPSRGMPSASESSSSASVGLARCSAASSRAFSRTSSSSSSSRHGYRVVDSTSPSGSDRWSATENSRISTIVSPSNSMRSG